MICGHKCRKAEELKAHTELHHVGQKPFKCSECNVYFTNDISRKKHFSMRHKVHKEKENLFTCARCSETFWTKLEFTKHNVSVHGLKKHKCPQCENCFALGHHLKRLKFY